MIDAPALPPPAIVTPAPREVSFGLVAGLAPPGTRRVIVRISYEVIRDEPLSGRRFSVRIPMPSTSFPLHVTAVDGSGHRSTSTVRPVFGLPPTAQPRHVATSLDPVLGRTVRSLTRAAGGITGVYVQDLRTGRGAAWNARARFPAASTLKLAIAVTVLRSLDGKPAADSRVAGLLHAMLVRSDNASANALEVWLGGSTGAGSARVDETMRALGLRDSLMYGGYEETRSAAALREPIPIRVERRPAFEPGKFTTAWDLGRLARAVYLAAVGKGLLVPLGVTASEARYLLWLLAQVEDRGKLDRHLGAGPVVLHKAGWLPEARHDSGIVVFSGGAYVASVMTWRTPGADDFAGRVSLAALRRFRSVG